MEQIIVFPHGNGEKSVRSSVGRDDPACRHKMCSSFWCVWWSHPAEKPLDIS